jgi:hypothetical protein
MTYSVKTCQQAVAPGIPSRKAFGLGELGRQTIEQRLKLFGLQDRIFHHQDRRPGRHQRRVFLDEALNLFDGEFRRRTRSYGCGLCRRWGRLIPVGLPAHRAAPSAEPDNSVRRVF